MHSCSSKTSIKAGIGGVRNAAALWLASSLVGACGLSSAPGGDAKQEEREAPIIYALGTDADTTALIGAAPSTQRLQCSRMGFQGTNGKLGQLDYTFYLGAPSTVFLSVTGSMQTQTDSDGETPPTTTATVIRADIHLKYMGIGNDVDGRRQVRLSGIAPNSNSRLEVAYLVKANGLEDVPSDLNSEENTISSLDDQTLVRLLPLPLTETDREQLTEQEKRVSIRHQNRCEQLPSDSFCFECAASDPTEPAACDGRALPEDERRELGDRVNQPGTPDGPVYMGGFWTDVCTVVDTSVRPDEPE